MSEPGSLVRTLSGRQSAKNYHSYVITEVGLAIASGRQAVGSILPNDAEMMDAYGVSRTVLREALKKQRYRVHSDDVALPEVHTGQVPHSDAPETPEKHKSINYENVAIPEVHIPKKKP